MIAPKLDVVKVPMFDTRIGREAGFKDDAELIAAGKAQRARLEELLVPEALAHLDAAEAELERKILLGDC